MFANCQAGGMDFAFPDVCLTPPLPIPVAYPNFAFGMTAIPNVLHILFSSAPAHNMGTITPVTTGDEPGSMGGVCSGTVKGLSRHITGANAFLLAGLPATRLTDITQQNVINVIGARVLPSQDKILLMCS